MKKLVLITGVGRGIGREIAIKLKSEGYVVSGCSRSRTDLEETKKLTGIHVAQIDVTQAGALQTWIKSEIAANSDATPWGLVTAAGIHGDINRFIDSDWKEWTRAIEVNLYGTALAAKFFASELIARKLPGRLVLLSGGGATQAIENMTAYCASKAAVVRFGETLAQELKSYSITVNAVAPGGVNTAMTKTIIDAGPDRAGRELYEKTLKQLENGGTTPDKAANLAHYLMSEESAPVTGKLISAVWDDWSTFHKQLALVGHKDHFTLRRMVPNA